jgi:hypothetical protein
LTTIAICAIFLAVYIKFPSTPQGTQMRKLIALFVLMLALIGAGNSFAQTASGTTTFTLFAGGDTGGSADTIYAADVASRYIDTQFAESVTIWATLDSVAGTNPAWYIQALVSVDGSTWDTINVAADSLEAEADRIVICIPAVADTVRSSYLSAAAAATTTPYLLNYLKLFCHETVAGGTCGIKAKAIVRGWGPVQIHGTQPY